MNITLFSVDEANAVATEIGPELTVLVREKQELDRVQARLQVLEIALAGATAGNPDSVERDALTRRQGWLAERIRVGVRNIHRRGCVLKDLDVGLVDFYSLNGDRLIFLCWKLGEPTIGHWHTLEGGYSSRQPFHETGRE